MSKAFVQYPILCPEFQSLPRCILRGLPLIITWLAMAFAPDSLQARDLYPSPQNTGVLNKSVTMGLLPVQGHIPDIVIDLRYATPHNVTKRALYPPDMPCLLHHMTLARLKRAQKTLRRKGLRLKIWDAYRPPQAHRALWRATQAPGYVVPPEKGLSLHCYGVAVDVTLVDRQGRQLLMPTDHDEFSPAAASDYTGDNPVIHRNLQILQKAMKKAGFSTIESEWWHFINLEPQGARAIDAHQLGIQLPATTSLRARPIEPTD